MTTELILLSTGEIKRRTIEEATVEVSANVLSGLAANVRFSFRHMLDDPEIGVAHLTCQNQTHLWSVELKQITLKTGFLVQNGLLVPGFNREGTAMVLDWPVPESLKLRLAVQLTQNRDDSRWRLTKMWLFGFAANQTAWRLPLANVYEDCSVCAGDFDADDDTSVGSLRKCLRQFRNSRWNSDLWEDQEKTWRFFRFDPATTPFKALPIDNTAWTNLCKKVATPITEQVVI